MKTNECRPVAVSRRIRVRDAVDSGNGWIEAMTTALQRLDQLCAAE
jgi:hypothetical protein